MTNTKKILQRDQSQSKSFSYKKGNVSLNFTLRIDIKQDLKDFKDCLIAAVDDVETEIQAK